MAPGCANPSKGGTTLTPEHRPEDRDAGTCWGPRASTPPSPEPTGSQEQPCQSQTATSIGLHTLHGWNEAFHLSRKVELAGGVSRQPAAAVLPMEGAHTCATKNKQRRKNLLCKKRYYVPPIPPPEQHRAESNQESLKLRVTSDSFYLQHAAAVPAGGLTAARPRLEQRARRLPAHPHPRRLQPGGPAGPRRGTTSGNPTWARSCKLVDARAQPAFRGNIPCAQLPAREARSCTEAPVLAPSSSSSFICST